MRRQAPEMDEGPQAFERFRNAVKQVLSVPKSALPPIAHRPPATQKNTEATARDLKRKK